MCLICLSTISKSDFKVKPSRVQFSVLFNFLLFQSVRDEKNVIELEWQQKNSMHFNGIHFLAFFVYHLSAILIVLLIVWLFLWLWLTEQNVWIILTWGVQWLHFTLSRNLLAMKHCNDKIQSKCRVSTGLTLRGWKFWEA